MLHSGLVLQLSHLVQLQIRIRLRVALRGARLIAEVYVGKLDLFGS